MKAELVPLQKCWPIGKLIPSLGGGHFSGQVFNGPVLTVFKHSDDNY